MEYKMPFFYFNCHRLSEVSERLQKHCGRELSSTICKNSKKPVIGKKYCAGAELFRSQFLNYVYFNHCTKCH